MTLLDVSTVYEDWFDGIITDNAMSIWQPDDFGKIVEEFNKLMAENWKEYERNVMYGTEKE